MFDDIDFIAAAVANVVLSMENFRLYFSLLTIRLQCHGFAILRVDDCYLWADAQRRMAFYLISH